MLSAALNVEGEFSSCMPFRSLQARRNRALTTARQATTWKLLSSCLSSTYFTDLLRNRAAELHRVQLGQSFVVIFQSFELITNFLEICVGLATCKIQVLSRRSEKVEC